ncbi:hypothetical protein SASPL_134465 [Salvia splendens]|uniref:Uncharacterized protein n=1 Tax=Salvia splendens TaxID=180675 RepID=A0A8X8X661_SALSN|nr:protein SOB FIVE-LIKE 6-like [Salvia splendens]KAG6406854.1 hypothetical protein SASPL_134465 [Salvia splendens]
MNASTSDYSSGCESGWTTYFDQISNSTYNFYTNYHDKGGAGAYSDEDQSMVSDASSAPPHHSAYYAEAEEKKTKTKKKKKSKGADAKKEKQAMCLDDTASSSIFHFSQSNVPPSDFSAVHFEGESVTKKRLSFFKSSTKGKSGSSEK